MRSLASFIAAAVLFLSPSWASASDHCPADLDGNGEVRVPDLIMLLAAWGSCSSVCGDNIAGNTPSETCDGTDDSGCVTACRPPGAPNECTCCGDGIIQGNEECESGADCSAGQPCVGCVCQPVCDESTNDCCMGSLVNTPGCNNSACCDCICACDPFCCGQAPGGGGFWDSNCAGCGIDGSCGASNPNSGCADVCAACVEAGPCR